MSDDTFNNGNGNDDVTHVEALLRGLDQDDLELTAPPAELWAGIERAIATPAPVVPLKGRSRQRWLLAAAAVFVLAIAGGVVALVARGDDPDEVSTAVLQHDPAKFDPRGADSTATAHLVELDGHYELALTDTDLPNLEDDDLELWLIEPDSNGNPVDIQPISLIKGSRPDSYKVPDGLDPASHFVVDISIEPRDGNAADSGLSILRGPLQAT